jgi:hypothetical protein
MTDEAAGNIGKYMWGGKKWFCLDSFITRLIIFDANYSYLNDLSYYRMIETDLMIEFGQIMDETEQWAGLFESFW